LDKLITANLFFIVIVFNNLLAAQTSDSIYGLPEITVTSRHVNGIGWMNDYANLTIYAGISLNLSADAKNNY